MKIHVFLILALLFIYNSLLKAQSVGIGTNIPHASSQLEVLSTTKGMLVPRMTQAQRDIIATPATGLIIYQTNNTPGFYFYNGLSWVQLSTGSATNYWAINGSNNIYNTNAGGRIGINTTNPGSRLEVFGDALISGGGPLKLKDDGTLQSQFRFEKNDGTPTHQITHLGGTNPLLMIQKVPASTLDWVMDANGRVGMGLTDPAVKLHLFGNTGEQLRLDATTDPQLGLAQEGVLKGVLRLGGDNIVLGAPATNSAGKLIIRLGGADRMQVQPDGRVSIGTAIPATGYMLSVNGKIISEEVRVELDVNWPDYVFKPGYKLPSLKQVENFIQTNHHLPGIPSAEQVKKEGIELGDMNKRLLEKVEEITLYLLQQNKEIDALKNKIAELEKNNSNQ